MNDQVVEFPKSCGIAEDAADHFTMKMMPGELHLMLMKKFIWKAKSMSKEVKND